MKSKKNLVIGISVAALAVLILLVLFFLYILFGVEVKETEDISYYRALSGECEGNTALSILGERLDVHCNFDLPLLSELEPYEDYHFNYTAQQCSIYESHAYILIVDYSEAEYQEKKSELRSVYTICSDVIPGESDFLSPEFTLDGFSFFAADGDNYPKEMLFAGTSDEQRKVAYIFFYDMDLDYITPGLEQLIRDETGWDRIAD